LIAEASKQCSIFHQRPIPTLPQHDLEEFRVLPGIVCKPNRVLEQIVDPMLFGGDPGQAQLANKKAPAGETDLPHYTYTRNMCVAMGSKRNTGKRSVLEV